MGLFRIKNCYKFYDQESGEIKKFKEEYLISAVNYTEAETFIVKFNEMHDYNRYVRAEYEIIKEKFTADDIYVNDVIDHDTDSIGRYVELFFENETDRLFGVTVKYFGDKEQKEKDYKMTYYIPGKDMESAVNYFNTRIASRNDDYMITKTTADNMTSLFLSPEIWKSLMDRKQDHGL